MGELTETAGWQTRRLHLVVDDERLAELTEVWNDHDWHVLETQKFDNNGQTEFFVTLAVPPVGYRRPVDDTGAA